MEKTELLGEIKQKLDQALNLAVEAGGFTLFYLIEMARLELDEMSESTKSVGDEPDKLDAPTPH